MKSHKKHLKKSVIIFLIALLLISSVTSPVFGDGADQAQADEVTAQINALPSTYEGLPLLNGTASEINYTTNAQPPIEDTTVSFEGVHPVKVTSITGGRDTPAYFGKTFDTPLDLSSLTNIEFLLWFYEVNPSTHLSGMRVSLVTSSGNYYYKYVQTSYWSKSSGACRIRLDISEFSRIGNPDLSNITRIEIRMSGQDGMIQSLGLFSVTYNARGVPKVILTFDDGWQDNYDYAFPVLEPRGIKAVTYVCSNFVQGSDPNYMKINTLNELYAAGWDISNHSKGHQNYLVNTDLANMKEAYQVCQDYLLNQGLTRSARFVCYPNGSYDDNLIAELKNIGVVSARTTRVGLNASPFIDLYKVKQVTVGKDTTFGVDSSSNDIKATIDVAIATGQTLAIMMHRVMPDHLVDVPGPSSSSIITSVTKLTQIADYINSKGLEVCTMSRWYDEITTDANLTLASKTAVKAARAAYSALTSAQKTLVTNLNKLAEAEARLALLEADFTIVDGVLTGYNGTENNIYIPDDLGIIKIGNRSMRYNTRMTCVTIPNSVIAIEENAFQGCTSLNALNIPNSVTSLGGYAFEGCSSLTSITIPKSIINIGERAFKNCTGLKSVIIPDNVESIGVSAFSDCPLLTVFCNSGSYAQTYLSDSRIPFRLKGDISADNNITSVDALQALQAASGRRTLTDIEKAAAEVTGDGKVTAVDALKILQFASGRIITFD